MKAIIDTHALIGAVDDRERLGSLMWIASTLGTDPPKAHDGFVGITYMWFFLPLTYAAQARDARLILK